jgi:hypothetical protein
MGIVESAAVLDCGNISLVVFAAAALVVCTNREMFFEKVHIGKIINQ